MSDSECSFCLRVTQDFLGLGTFRNSLNPTTVDRVSIQRPFQFSYLEEMRRKASAVFVCLLACFEVTLWKVLV